jgi:hypothetical protein
MSRGRGTGNIELRAEIHQDFCKISTEVREPREVINNLGKQQKCDVFRRHREEAKWNENTITSQIAEAKSNAIERELQLRHEFYDVAKKDISTKWAQRLDRGERLEQSTTPMEGIAIDGTMRPTIEEFSENLISSGGLDESRHAPNKPRIGSSTPENGLDDGQHPPMAGNPRDPPTGSRV